MKDIINCSIGIISNDNGYLFLKRKKEPYKNFFEFPGGKIEKNEKPAEALQREFMEELSIFPRKINFINKIIHEYKEFKVCLHIFKIITYEGTISSNKQEISYCEKDNFKNIECLASTYRIIKLLNLPRFLSISRPNDEALNESIELINKEKDLLVRFRDKDTYYNNNSETIIKVFKSCKENNVKFIIDHPHEKIFFPHYDGVHYKSKFLSSVKRLPIDFKYYSCSCHNADEIKKANLLNFDYILISPIKGFKNLNQKCLGWEKFRVLSSYANMPTFALGGVSKEDIELSKKNEGYGVSGIRNFW